MTLDSRFPPDPSSKKGRPTTAWLPSRIYQEAFEDATSVHACLSGYGSVSDRKHGIRLSPQVERRSARPETASQT